MIVEAGFLISGAALAASRFFKRTRRIHEREKWCGWCEAPKVGHKAHTLQCPCTWKREDGQWTIIHFFKPMTIEDWMKREGTSI